MKRSILIFIAGFAVGAAGIYLAILFFIGSADSRRVIGTGLVTGAIASSFNAESADQIARRIIDKLSALPAYNGDGSRESYIKSAIINSPGRLRYLANNDPANEELRIHLALLLNNQSIDPNWPSQRYILATRLLEIQNRLRSAESPSFGSGKTGVNRS